MVASLQTFGSFANLHPLIHALVTNGIVTPDEEFLPLAHWTPRTLVVDPLLCPRCQVEMVIVSVLTDSRVVDRILYHRDQGRGRDPFAEHAPPGPPGLEKTKTPY